MGCACQVADPGIDETTSSCSTNTDGTVVCDPLTLHCRAPRDYDSCATAACDTGYLCLGLPVGDGGVEPTCVQPCSAATDCTNASTHCVSLSALGAPPVDGGPTSACAWNNCGPGIDSSAFFGACDSADAGDGQCVPGAGLTDGGAPIGTCVRLGALATGDACSSGGGECSLCGLGSLCGLSGSDAPRDTCLALCDANQPACTSGQVCAPFGIVPATPNAGACEPQAPGKLESVGGTTYPAHHGAWPTVVNNGGPVLSNPHVVVFNFKDLDAGSMDAYLSNLVTSDWLQTVGADYGVSTGTYSLINVSDDAPTGTVDDAQIEGDIERWIKDSSLNVPQPDANTVYFTVFPPNLTITSGLSQSCTGFGGYHSEISGVQTLSGIHNVIYAVIPDCGPGFFPGLTELGYMEVAASHELIEAASDPDFFSAPGWIMDDSSNPWDSLGGEIGDECAWNDVQLPFGWAQRIWSLSEAASGTGSPCVPLAEEPFFAISATGPSGSSEAASASSGSTVVFTLTGWSTQPVQPFTVSLVQFSQTQKTWTWSLDTTELSNGKQGHLTIHVPPNDSGDQLLLLITAARPGQTNNIDDYWPIEVNVP